MCDISPMQLIRIKSLSPQAKFRKKRFGRDVGNLLGCTEMYIRNIEAVKLQDSCFERQHQIYKQEKLRIKKYIHRKAA